MSIMVQSSTVIGLVLASSITAKTKNGPTRSSVWFAVLQWCMFNKKSLYLT